MWEAEFRCSPTQALDLRATFYRIAAMEALASAPGPIFSTGKDRGKLWQARADYRFGPRYKTLPADGRIVRHHGAKRHAG